MDSDQPLLISSDQPYDFSDINAPPPATEPPLTPIHNPNLSPPTASNHSNPPPPPPLRRRYSSGRSFNYSPKPSELNEPNAGRFVYINDAARSNSPHQHPTNSVHTTKYSLLTFVPKNLFEQFHRIAYVYFFTLVCINQIPQLGVFSPAASILPLAFVLSVTALKDAYEDHRRRLSDRSENSRLASIFSPASSTFEPKPWSQIRVGELVRVAADEPHIPCDLVLLCTSDPTGVAYVQTINLDGESNLKTCYAKQETLSKPPESLSGSLILCERPNRNIYGFRANLNDSISLGPANVVLRGCELKNTAWVVGVAVYTGKETKVMLNSSGAPTKRSRLETHMNRETVLLAVGLFALCAVVTVLGGAWLGRHKGELDELPYYRKRDFSGRKVGKYEYYGIGWEIVFTFLMAVILFQVLIPIALYISMELVRLGQAFFMIQDENMFDKERGKRFQCRALNINEDLGQIRYVFSDKTGTLTENKMEFRCVSVGGLDYSGGGGGGDQDGVSVVVEGKLWKPKMKVKTDPKLVELLRKEEGNNSNKAREFFLALATCNTIVPILTETGDPAEKLIDYQGESPDEQALVYAAAAYGFVLVERTSGHIVVDVFGQRQSAFSCGYTKPSAEVNKLSSGLVYEAAADGLLLIEQNFGHIIIDVLGDLQRLDILGLHEFDSDRKRMSVIVGFPDKTVKIFVKGADNSMLGVMEKASNMSIIQATESHLKTYSSVGLRTLVIGMRMMNRMEFEEWHSSYEKASTALFRRGSLLKAVASNIETNLNILGASGIEDKLQQGVPEAIESLRQAGIKVWVLTGDKQETAISIGYSCKLLSGEMNQIIINSSSKESCKKSLEEALATITELSVRSGAGRNPLALIIDGKSLLYILETELEGQLFKIAISCQVVLCCRVAPLQKAGIVALIKKRTNDMTLAIGDGANDVSMIQMADVGIGISGEEGRQAVMASDFAMGQFRFLVPLLLVHGHWNYQRIAYMILYNFYRNSIFVFALFWFILYTAFSLTTAVTEWSSVLYSVIYTALPTIVIGILDKDLSRKTLLRYPQLYGSGQREERYNLKLFILTMMDSIWQSLVIFFIPYLAYRHSTVDGSSIGDLWTLAVVIMVNIHLGMDVSRWNWVTHVALWGCIIATFICVIIIDAFPILPGFRAIFHLMATWVFWFCLAAILVVGMVPRFTMKAFFEFFFPSDIQIARELEKFRNINGSHVSEVAMTTLSNNRQHGML